MIILGVDPGSVCTGYGIVSFNRNKFRRIDQGIITPPKTLTFPERLKYIYDGLVRIIDIYKPSEFAIETAFYGKNVQSALKIGMARGIAMLAAINYSVPVSEYSPREVKRAVVGAGAASKTQVQYMVCSLLNVKEDVFQKYDESDALAIAICHAFRISSLIPGSGRAKDWKSFIQANPDRIIE